MDGSGAAHCSVVHNSTDRRALLDFKEAITVDPTGVLRSWNDSIHHCMWPGVNCSRRHPWRVTVLDLQDMSLAGQITPSLGNLTFLRKLTLGSNRLSGQLPPLNRLIKLEELFLEANLLHGKIPDALTNCSKLSRLDLSSNLLAGSIPRNIGFLSNLQGMSLSGNNLSGNIPQTFSNITKLTIIALEDNLLVGSIPEELGQLKNMSQMLLGGNSLSGRVPGTMFNLSELIVLDLDTNMSSSTLPFGIGNTLPSLITLFLGRNKFKGHIPDSLGNLSELEMIDLSSNYFTGQIPSYFGRLHKLTHLNLGRNKLEARDSQSWEFLSALSHCPLEKLSLHANQLEGLLPNSVGNLSIKLQQLNLGQNNLFGIVPPTIGKYRNLFKLTLSYNNLTGTIEKWAGTLKNLQGLDLEGNTFVGPIPNSLGNLNKLISLYLSKNQFDGVLLSNLENLSQLTQLDLSYNDIQGSIPLQISSLKQLTELHLSSNKLTGEMLNNFDQCNNLITIQMDQNMLIGEIPTSFGNLMALNVLNISQNNLSGTIPATLSDLQLLSKLDLSHNHLHGEIPRNGIFRNATSIYLEGNWGLCGGVADLQMPLCSVDSHRLTTEYYLVRILVPTLGFTSLIMLAYIIILRKNTSRRTYVSFLSCDKSFVTECEVLRSIRHRNLVPILTACSTIDNNDDAFKALVYEFMPNGNLDTWLHNRFLGSPAKHLNLVQRASIAVGIADALTYLHHDCEEQIIHCDLKRTNILLDDDMNAYLGDFGISSLTGHLGSNTSVGLKGTIGYISPEYAQSGRASISGDVYSFGIVLLEMLIGKRPTDPLFENEVNIVNFAERNYPDEILHIVDACLDGERKAYIQANIGIEDAAYGCLLSLMQVALSCTRLIPGERMGIREVAARLNSIRTSYIKTTR